MAYKHIFSSCISCLLGLSMFLYLLKLLSTSQDVTVSNLKQLTSWLDQLLTAAVDINSVPSRTFDIIFFQKYAFICKYILFLSLTMIIVSLLLYYQSKKSAV